MPTFGTRASPPSPIAIVRREGIVRLRELQAHGVSKAAVLRLCERGELRRIGRGLYALPDRDLGEHESLIEVAKRVPDGIVCLLSALRFHGLTTQNPSEVWLAIERKARKPRIEWPPLRVVWWSGEAFAFGVAEKKVSGVQIRITSPAKTVADCFKYRHKIGLDVALEALRDYRRSRRSLDELHRATEICRVERVVRTYLEALA
jgi:predicted transcriptional regulator of viral defense system